MIKVAVVGSNSFSGSDFVDLLLQEGGYEVIGLSRSPEKPALFLPYKRRDASSFTFHQADLNRDMPRIMDILDAEKPRYIINFAAQSEVAPSWDHPWQWFMTNTVALAHLVNGLKDRSWLERYVHISSPEAYGTCEGRVDESKPLNPSTPYAASKAAADMLLATYVKNFSFPLVTIRATNVYGAHQQLFKIIPRTAIYLKLGRRIQLHGGGKAVKSYIHIRDVSRGEKLAMEQGRPGQTYHLSPDQGVEVRQVVATICRLMSKDFGESTETVGERLGQDKAYVIDSSKARAELGWLPRVSLEEGLAEVIAWVDEYWPEIQKQSLEYEHQE